MTDTTTPTLEQLAEQQQTQANFLEDLARSVRTMAYAQQQQQLMARLSLDTPLRMGEYPTGSDVAPAGTTDPGSTNVIADGSVVASSISPGAITLPLFASTVRPVALVTALPALPDTNYPIGAFVYKTNDVPARLYKNVANAWVAAIGPNDIQADSITAGQIAAGAVTTSELAAGAITLYDANLQTALSPAGFGPVWRRFLMGGCFNGDFYAGTATPANVIDNALNFLPNWTWHVISGSAITAKWVADATVASGGRLAWTGIAGAAGDDAGIEQIVPVNGAAARSYAYSVAMAYETRVLGNPATTYKWYVRGQYLKSDGVTTTGSAVETEAVVQSGLSIAGSTWRDVVVNMGNVPKDAYYLLIRAGLRRATGLTSDTQSAIKMGEIRVIAGSNRLELADDFTQTDDTLYTYTPGYIRQTNGKMTVEGSTDLVVTPPVTLTGGILSLSGNVASTFAPVMTNDGGATYTTKNSWYHLIGKLCFISIEIQVNGVGSAGGAISFTLPVAPSATVGNQVLSGFAQGFTTFLPGPINCLLTNAAGVTAVRDQVNLTLNRSHYAAAGLLRITGVYFTA